ncbi:flavodoxin [Thiococcus pfennigii]|jgi:flavodoxin I|uniref:flavodoxin n=1 Tax=Thiococcus pfennigii TaxID=1057 RepID=UPI001908B973|nr:flavodoxin [Thiococcus pfennigii]MBK1700307.1 flavodoxin [Thiococcus pfennigii]MBK1730557.1 flavodoxin [Thiococcus pfennigii]
MRKIGLFYASDTGNTRRVAKMIQSRYFDEGIVEICDFEEVTAERMSGYDALIIGTPTVGAGEFPVALEDFLPELEGVDFSGKTVALYGLGDQEQYAEEFVDALGMLYEVLDSRGAHIVGLWSTDGYRYGASKADLGDGTFCGLVLDEDNQPEETDARLAAWIERIRPALLG